MSRQAPSRSGSSDTLARIVAVACPSRGAPPDLMERLQAPTDRGNVGFTGNP